MKGKAPPMAEGIRRWLRLIWGQGRKVSRRIPVPAAEGPCVSAKACAGFSGGAQGILAAALRQMTGMVHPFCRGPCRSKVRRLQGSMNARSAGGLCAGAMACAAPSGDAQAILAAGLRQTTGTGSRFWRQRSRTGLAHKKNMVRLSFAVGETYHMSSAVDLAESVRLDWILAWLNGLVAEPPVIAVV